MKDNKQKIIDFIEYNSPELAAEHIIELFNSKPEPNYNMGNTEQPTLLDNWIGWLQARIPVLKESHNVYWLKQAMGGYKSENEQYFKKDVEPEVKILSAAEHLKSNNPGRQNFTFFSVCDEMESFASLAVEKERKKHHEEIVNITRQLLGALDEIDTLKSILNDKEL